MILSNDSSDWEVITPIPKEIPFPDLKTDVLIKRNEDVIGTYKYTTSKNETMGYVVKFKDKDNKKSFSTLTFCRHIHGTCHWYWREFEDFPIYNLYELIQNPEKNVLIVEGEDTCEAAKLLFPDWVIISWYEEGSSSGQPPDWSVLKDRKVTLWPNADMIGKTVMNDLLKKLIAVQVSCVSTVEPSFNKASLPLGWDLADKLPPEWEAPNSLQKVLEDRKLLYIDMKADSSLVNREPTL